MEKDDSTEENSLKSPSAEAKGPTMDAENEVWRKEPFAEGNASHVSVEDDEARNSGVIVAEKETEDLKSTLKTEQVKGDQVRKSMSDSPTYEANASHVVLEDDENKKANLVVTERENEDRLDPFEKDHYWKSKLDSPTAEANASHVLTGDEENKKADLIVNVRENEDLLGPFENDEKKDDSVWKNTLDSLNSEANASHVVLEDDGNRKMDLTVTERENEDLLDLFENDQKKDDLVSSRVQLEDDENKRADPIVTERENGDVLGPFESDQKKDDLVSSHVIKEDDENKRADPIVTERRNDLLGPFENDPEKNEFVHKSMPTSPTTESFEGNKVDIPNEDLAYPYGKIEKLNVGEEGSKVVKNEKIDELECKTSDGKELGSENEEKGKENPGEVDGVEKSESVFDGTEIPGMEINRVTSSQSLDPNPDSQGSFSEKAVAVKNYVREKSVGAVSTVIRRLSGRSDDGAEDNQNEKVKDENNESAGKEHLDSPKESETKDDIQKTGEKAGWNPLSLIGISRDTVGENKAEQQVEVTVESLLPIPMKGRILLYTRLGCAECKEARIFLRRKKLGYVEINVDVYPSRKLELEKIAGSPSVPRVFFNEIHVGGLSDMKSLDEAGKLAEKIEYVVTEAPPYEAPLPPHSGEDDMSTFGAMDELALIVRNMKVTIVVKDRFYKMRRFTNCFLGSEAVDFLSEDQYLERADAVEFGRKLATGLFFQHVLEENLFEDGNHLYRFLDQDPIVMSQCYNIPRGIIEVKPKSITEISSRLRFLSYAIFEAYTSEDGRHVDYRSIHGSEEFARYLRIIEELQRVDLNNMSREEKLAFFINLFNMMVIHAILVLGHPSGTLERRKMLGDFKYIIGGCTYSLSAIQNGILRGNQRPPYTLTKPFGLKDKRAKVALPYPEPLIHFALVFGNRSSPQLRCYSPGDVDKELMEAARNFLRSGGLTVDLNMKVTSVSKILNWYSVDFGKNEVEVLKHAANYLEPDESEAMLELLATTQLKVIYQAYDWGLNN